MKRLFIQKLSKEMKTIIDAAESFLFEKIVSVKLV